MAKYDKVSELYFCVSNSLMLVVVFLNKQNPLLDYFRGQIAADVNCIALSILNVLNSWKCKEDRQNSQ